MYCDRLGAQDSQVAITRMLISASFSKYSNLFIYIFSILMKKSLTGINNWQRRIQKQ